MKTPNFTTRIPEKYLVEFREAADIWAGRQKEYLAGGDRRNLTRWMLSVLIEAAREEIRTTERPGVAEPLEVER